MTRTHPPTYCTGCGCEIDPDVCHCGDEEDKHTVAAYWSNPHHFIPMGCLCGYATRPAELFSTKERVRFGDPVEPGANATIDFRPYTERGKVRIRLDGSSVIYDVSRSLVKKVT